MWEELCVIRQANVATFEYHAALPKSKRTAHDGSIIESSQATATANLNQDNALHHRSHRVLRRF